MSMVNVFTVFCDGPDCTVTFNGKRPAARDAGWSCDTVRGLDLCPDHVALGPNHRPRVECGFCGKNLSISRHSGTPTQHMTEGAGGVKVRCPGSYMAPKKEMK